MTECPCGSGKAYAQCCQRYHNGEAAPNAEALMRSRYAAFVLELEPYLLATWHADSRPDQLDLQEPPKPKWIGLQVKRHEQEGARHCRIRSALSCRRTCTPVARN